MIICNLHYAKYNLFHALLFLIFFIYMLTTHFTKHIHNVYIIFAKMYLPKTLQN